MEVPQALDLYDKALISFPEDLIRTLSLRETTAIFPDSYQVVPYKSLSDVIMFLDLCKKKKLPTWLSETSPLTPATKYCNLHSEILSQSKQAVLRRTVPKTLVCHDYKNGYLQDRFVNYNWEGGYIFTEWSTTDLFVYFSHNLVTVPPPCWINAGHAHGVPVLGTLITEGEEGKKVWDVILEKEELWLWFADALILISQVHGFDGYLMNVENCLDDKQVLSMLEFLRYLKRNLAPGSKVIWYDSVTKSGALDWQNSLNRYNEDYFQACDGIFLNYNIKNWELEKSSELAGSRKHDVYVGIDVHGRGAPGSGFFSSDGARMAREHGLSIAIFAPGWTEESVPGNPFLNNRIFWSALSRFLYTHGRAGTLDRPYTLLGRKENGLPNFNNYTGVQTNELFLWSGRFGSVMLALTPPSAYTCAEKRALLNLQDAVVTYKEKNILSYYPSFSTPVLDVDYTDDMIFGSTLRIDTRPQVTVTKIPIMIFEVNVTSGIVVEINARGDGKLQGYFSVDTGAGGVVDFVFDIHLSPDQWVTGNKSQYITGGGELLEVGVKVDPSVTASIRFVRISNL